MDELGNKIDEAMRGGVNPFDFKKPSSEKETYDPDNDVLWLPINIKPNGKRALITGITGQDGSYLAEFLLKKGYEVHGLVRRSSAPNHYRVKHIMDKITLHEGDLTDYARMQDIVRICNPDEIYNLAAQSHVGSSYNQTDYTWDVTAKGCMYLLDIILAIENDGKEIKFYQASSSEMYGDQYDDEIEEGIPCGVLNDGTIVSKNEDGEIVPLVTKKERYQNENTKFNPRSPYAVAKLAAHNMVDIHRKGYGTFAVAGILFNHDSERRGENFVTRKITKWIGNYIKAKNQGETYPKLYLGDLSTYRDLGHAEDYVEAMWLMLQQDEPEDFVIATNQTCTITQFLKDAFSVAGLDTDDLVEIQAIHKRPLEVPYLNGDSSKAREKLGWTPKVTYKQLVERMVRYDIDNA